MPGHRTDNPDLTRYATTRTAGGLLFIAGISARRADNTIPGVRTLANGAVELDALTQTLGCFDNLQILLQAHALDLAHVVDVTCFLVNMNDYGGFVDGFNQAFSGINPPTRTTVAVHQLPDPLLNVEIKAIAATSGSA